MARSGLVISRNTLGDWIDFIADSFSSVIEAMKKKILKGPIVQSDDTKVRVLGGPEEAMRDTSGATEGCTTRSSSISPRGGGREGPQRFLDGYQGYLQVDAYAGYDVVFARGKVLEVACWAHVRRKIFEARTTDPKRADPLLGMIAALYAVEAEAKGLTADGEALRDERSRPLLARIHERLLQARADVLPKSPMGQAVTYALNQWAALQRYLEDGRLAIDNNATERSCAAWPSGARTGSSPGARRADAARPFSIRSSKAAAGCAWTPSRTSGTSFRALPRTRTAGQAAHTGRMEDYLPRDRRLRRRPPPPCSC
ncbi:MAG: IS66 family transposase [Holophagales bacterium]|nr:IS66 family transposase [Holophagales bacterium]